MIGKGRPWDHHGSSCQATASSPWTAEAIWDAGWRPNLQGPIYLNGHSNGLELDLHLLNDARHDPVEGKVTMKIVYPNPPATILRIWDGPSLKDIQ